MTLDNKINQNVWWVLQEIKKESVATPSDEYVRFEPGRDDNLQPEIKEQRRALKFLEKEGAIKIAREHYPLGMPYFGADLYNLKPIKYFLDILQPRFDELFKEYENSNTSQSKFSGNLNELCFDPITRNIESGKLPYKKDGLFYSLWKYTNASRLVGKRLISLIDLAPLEGNPHLAIFDFLNSLRNFKIELEHITFSEETYKKYCKNEHKVIVDFINKNPEGIFSKAAKKLFKNQAAFDEIFTLFGNYFDEAIAIKLYLKGLLEFIEFSTAPSQKNLKPLTNELETYTRLFIEDKLFSPELKNFYRFSRQKEIFLEQIERNVRDYGLDFIFKQGNIISVSKKSFIGSIGRDEAYLFIHTLAALEKQGLFDVERIFITDMEVPPEEQTDDYKVKILGSEKLLDEFKQGTNRILVSNEPQQGQETENEEDDDCFSYDGGISSPYENSDFELFILKKILLEHKQRDDAGFAAKELSFRNNSLREICGVINRLIEDKILYLSGNTHPEKIEDKRGFINWDFVEKLDKNPEEMNQENNFVSFDVDVIDEIRLKGRIDISVEEFMNDRAFNEFGYMVDIPEEAYAYVKQREIVLNKLEKEEKNEIPIQLNNFPDRKVFPLKTLLSLEKEGLLRIKSLDSKSIFDESDFIGQWSNTDTPTAKIQFLPRSKEQKISQSKRIPITFLEGDKGYFKFYKQGEKIKIGGVGTRHFRLLQFLCNPVGVAKTIDSVFDAIKLPKDKNDAMLNSYTPQQSFQKKISIIQFTIKELQKNKKIQKKLKFIFDQNQKTYRLEMI